jgi:hypothetical protein
MEIDRIPHMGGALRDEAPSWQKPANRRRPLPDAEPEREAEESEEDTAEQPDSPEEHGTLDVVA